MDKNRAIHCATAISLALALSTAYATGDSKTSPNATNSNGTEASKPMTGKEKATAIGATTGGVAGAVVGGPVGAVVGAGIGAYVGHEGTDASGKVTSTDSPDKVASNSDSTVRSAQAALNDRGYDAGPVDGVWGPNTQGAVRRFQADRGLTQSGMLDGETIAALDINR